MIYRIACVGRIKEQHFTQMLNEYKKEIDKRGRLEMAFCTLEWAMSYE